MVHKFFMAALSICFVSLFCSVPDICHYNNVKVEAFQCHLNKCGFVLNQLCAFSLKIHLLGLFRLTFETTYIQASFTCKCSLHQHSLPCCTLFVESSHYFQEFLLLMKVKLLPKKLKLEWAGLQKERSY